MRNVFFLVSFLVEEQSVVGFALGRSATTEVGDLVVTSVSQMIHFQHERFTFPVVALDEAVVMSETVETMSVFLLVLVCNVMGFFEILEGFLDMRVISVDEFMHWVDFDLVDTTRTWTREPMTFHVRRQIEH